MYQELFNYMSKEHDITLLENELQEIVRLVEKENKIIQAQKDRLELQEAMLTAINLVIELAMRTNTAFPRNEQQEGWFEEGLTGQHEFQARLNNFLNKII